MYNIIYLLLKYITNTYCNETGKSFQKSEFPRFLEWFYFKYIVNHRGD